MWVLLVALALVRSASAAEDPPEGTGPAAPGSPVPPLPPRQDLAEAVELYAQGSTAAARERIQELLARGSQLDPSIRVEALAWLGDILFVEQGLEAAREPFAALLTEDPDYHLDRFTHSDAVVDAFEAVRASLRPFVVPAPLLAPEPEPYPWLAFVPGGAVYYPERRVGLGVAFGTAQATGLGVSLWTRVEMQRLRKRAEGVEVDSDETGALQAEFDRLKALNVTGVVVGWGAYLTPIVWETARWGAGPTVSVGPGGVRVDGRF